MTATKNSDGLVGHGVSDLLSHASKAPGPSLPSGTILDALSRAEFEAMGEISVRAVASFHQQYGRLPTRSELGRIVTLTARALLAPDAPSYEVN